uniref:Uncharacterized protein n=1 Tax=Ditylum brightwellii TaxID=49249 RepID=A0A7S1ZH54_9STRA|mmetsp:Transcript_31817/g.47459  ORF Transcript_31817/g.47459 Transcript_31817/m.47459 type:complete len:202 (+) Transcript_31817:467-1072(+)
MSHQIFSCFCFIQLSERVGTKTTTGLTPEGKVKNKCWEELAAEVAEQHEYYKMSHSSLDCIDSSSRDPYATTVVREKLIPGDPLNSASLKESADLNRLEVPFTPESDFLAIPLSKRGKLKIDQVRYIVGALYEEVMSWYKCGRRGEELEFDRTEIRKFFPPSLQSMKTNTDLLRDVENVLIALDIVKHTAYGDLTLHTFPS